MARPLNDSPYLYGLHDPGGEHIMAEKGTRGWILFTEALGNDPNGQGGGDYSRYAEQGFGIMVRLNNGYEPHGTIPFSNRYAEFAQRCANFVRNSRGCHIWIIGNEMNFAVERPGVQIDRSKSPPVVTQPGETILPGMYVRCYRQCRDAIKAVPGHQNDQVIVGAVAPWNAQTTYPENPSGDWIKYFQDILTPLAPNDCDGISIHAYTHGTDPKLVYTDAYMNPPFQNRQYNFRTYQDFMNAIPRSMRSLPVYLTETDQDEPWRNENTGWVQRAYGEIDWWNRQPGNQVIRAVILYRWSNADQWVIEGRSGVIEDFKRAMDNKYNWETVLASKTTTTEPSTPVVVTPVTPTTPTVVTPTTPSTEPITFKEVGKSTSGLFAAFHRQYGLDVTGYPLTDIYVNPDSGLRTQDWQRLSMEEYQGKIRLRLVGETVVKLSQQTTELQNKISRLERQISQLQSGIGAPVEPDITDITAQLARDPARFVKRALSDIQHIVINHTAVRPEVGADRVAQSHARKWPGIVAQYFITGDGQIQQTNPLDEVVEREQAWIYNGINIYLAGNFDEVSPSAAQLEALAHLCAWLLRKFNLPETAIKGVSEFIITRSPGLQWLQGEKWKEKLLALVRAVPLGPATPAAPAIDEAQINALRAQIDQLQAQAASLQADLMVAETERAQLKAQVEALLKAQPGPARLTKPEMTDISVQLPRTPGSIKTRAADRIKFLVFNHTAVAPTVAVERIAAAHQQRWGAILYQYLITAEGTILQTNALTEVVDLSQQWIAEGVNIAMAGNFTTETPTEQQIQAAARLSAWLMQEYQIPVENVKGVSEFIVTQSPGIQWLQGKRWKDTLVAAIVAAQKVVGPVPTPGTGAADAATIADLRNQVAQLKASLSTALNNVTALQQERDKLLAQISQGTTDSQLAKQVQALTQQVQLLTAEKDALSRQVKTLTNEKATLNVQLQALSADKSSLLQQVETLTKERTTLTQQVAAAATEKTTLAQQIATLQQQIAKLQSGIATPAIPTTPTGQRAIEPPAMVDIVDKLPVHATARYDKRTQDKITHIAIHHSAGPGNVTPERIAQYHVNNGWPGMGYHFYVMPDGTIYQTNRLETISYQVYKQNHYSLGICVAGSFINGLIPTPKQIESVGHLAAWLMQKLNVPLKNVMGHKEFPENATTCPGNDWTTGQKWKEMVIAQIKAVQEGSPSPTAKTIGHYMLFWQRADSWAKEDWGAAANYFARFRPTAGFSPEDARNAEYVTIVGGVAGVPYETEQMLVKVGCKVERLAGVDFADTKRMLDELASTGRRFRTFSV